MRSPGPVRRLHLWWRHDRRIRVSLTVPGSCVLFVLGAAFFFAPSVADPSMAGFVWASILGLVVVGAAWPVAAALSLQVDGGSESAMSTRPVGLGISTVVPLRVGARLSEVALRWSGSAEELAVPVGPTAEVDMPILPLRRGQYRRLRLWVSCDAPFGILEFSRRVEIEMLRPLVVGPGPIDAVHVGEPEQSAAGDIAAFASGHGGDTVRAVRPYVSGDPAHLVHWPSSARAGTLVVRELEPPADRAVAVVVDLGSGRPDDGITRAATGIDALPTRSATGAELRGEIAVSRSAAVVRTLLARGVRVLLCTSESTDGNGPAGIVGEVADEDALLRRLARAGRGRPGSVPPGWSVLRVSADSDDG